MKYQLSQRMMYVPERAYVPTAIAQNVGVHELLLSPSSFGWVIAEFASSPRGSTPANAADEMRASPEEAAALEDALGVLGAYFPAVCGLVETESASFQERFRALSIGMDVWYNGEDAMYMPPPSQLMALCREIVELYGLLLILHRDTNKNFLYGNPLLRMESCAREEITPRIQFTFTLHDGTDRSENLDDWRVFFSSEYNERSEFFHQARARILVLYGVDEAFVKDKVVHLTTLFEIHDVADLETQEELFELPRRVGELYETLVPDTEWCPAHRTPLDYDEARVIYKGTKHMKEFIAAQVPIPIKTITMEKDWTRLEGHAIRDAVNRDGIVKLELTVHSARELMIALEVYASLEFTETVTITMEIGHDWHELELSLTDVLPKLSSSPPRRLQLVTASGPETMAQQVDAILFVLNSMDSMVRDVILRFPDIHLKTRVDEHAVSDFHVIGPLLDVLGRRVTSLEMDSCSHVCAFDDAAFAKTAENFDLDPIFRSCPNLQLLAVQTATLEGISELDERHRTRLKALRVQWPPVGSAVELIKSLHDPSTEIFKHLVEFSTQREDVVLQKACLETLKKTSRLQVLQLGIRDPSGCGQLSPLKVQLLAHHGDRLGLGSTAVAIMISRVVDVVTRTTGGCIDDSIRDLITEFVRAPVYRQVRLW